MKEQAKEQEKSQNAGWLAAWLPKPIPCSSNGEGLGAGTAPEPERVIPKPIILDERRTAIEEIRTELRAVTGHLINPSADGVRASLPHLERAVEAFGGYFATKERGQAGGAALAHPGLEAVRRELALACTLLDNAYVLQAGWAAQLGLNLDGTPKQLLYSRPGAAKPRSETAPPAEAWEG